MPPQKSNTEQEKTELVTKLDELSVLLKKLADEFLNLELDKGIVLLETKDAHDLVGLAGELQSFESLEGKDGEIFVSFLKDLAMVMESVGTLTRWRKQTFTEEVFVKALTLLRNVEEQMKEFIPTVQALDEKRKERKYETFGGLLQKVSDTIERKRHLILNGMDDIGGHLVF